MRAHWRRVLLRDPILVSACLVSVVLHGGALYAANRWGECLCRFGSVVCPKLCDSQRLDLELQAPPPPPPPPPRLHKPPPKPATVRRPVAHTAAPKRGRIVLPDEAFQKPQQPRAETTARLPSIPSEVAVKASETDAPVLATPTVFDRADELQPGAPGEFGLGGTGKSTDPRASGHSTTSTEVGPEAPPPAPVVSPQPPPPEPDLPKARGLSRPPRVLDWTEPPYPEQARRQGAEGTVALRVLVSASGRPEQVSIARSSGRSDFDEAAAAHVKETRFSPALKDGEPAAMTITFRVRFRLVSE